MLILILVSLSAISQEVKETFLLPKGFQGRVYVVFGQSNFRETPMVNGRRFYNIPMDGIFVTCSYFLLGSLSDREYYYVDSMGNKTIIPVCQDYNTLGDTALIFHNEMYLQRSVTDGDGVPIDIIEIQVMNRQTSLFLGSDKERRDFEEKLKAKTGRAL
ncbi:MAG: hypothetical protein EOP04_11165 [Proteobacteria bacterium]|nr:MAG: hypothetical protein EOP04_11165 [Pseudomonadota bacterium]